MKIDRNLKQRRILKLLKTGLSFRMKCVHALIVLAVCTLVPTTISAKRSFINPYPRYEAYHDGGDPGEALYLTKMIKSGDIVNAQKKAFVKESQLNSIESYSGYLTVNEQFNSNMFFWYFPAETNDKAPVVLWLQGGPGASSLFGLFTENGPVQIVADGKLKKREYYWSKNHNLIYIDNPVGTGFSFTDDENGYAKNEQDVGKDLYEAITQIFTLFPKLQHLDFWVTGESYAGKYVPALAYHIHNVKKNKLEQVPIQLKGVAIGNGLSDPIHQLKYGDYLYQLGLIDINARETFHNVEQKGIDCISKRDMDCAFKTFDSLINMDMDPAGSLFYNLTGYQTYYNYLRTKGDDIDKNMGIYLQSSKTRRAIHVGNNSFHDLEGENKVEEHLKLDVMDSVAPWISELLKYYRVCIYNGQLDVIVAYPLTLNYLQQLNFVDADSYKTAPRYIWKIDNEIAGYVKEAGNLIEILVRNAGHMSPMDQPKWIFDMLTRLTNGKGFI